MAVRLYHYYCITVLCIGPSPLWYSFLFGLADWVPFGALLLTDCHVFVWLRNFLFGIYITDFMMTLAISWILIGRSTLNVPFRRENRTCY